MLFSLLFLQKQAHYRLKGTTIKALFPSFHAATHDTSAMQALTLITRFVINATP